MKRSERSYPGTHLDLLGFTKEMWEKGWFDEYSEDHLLIKIIEGRAEDFYGIEQMALSEIPIFPYIDARSFYGTFITNFISKLMSMYHILGEEVVKGFVTGQLSAGKENYEEAQFFRAVSEVAVLAFFVSSQDYKRIMYEPLLNGKKNPEYRLVMKRGVTIDIEVKTPGFEQGRLASNKLMPTVLLDENGRKELKELCDENEIIFVPPRVMKLKEFINSATDKFTFPEDDNHLNLLFINWSYSEFAPSSFLEAYNLMMNPFNGIIAKPEVGIKLVYHFLINYTL